MMGSFLANVTKVSKMHSPTHLASHSGGTGDPNTYTHTTPSNTIRSSTSDLPLVSPTTHSLDGAAMTHHRQIVTNTVVNRQSLFSGSSSRGTNSVTNSYPWEMGNTDHQGLMRKHLDARQKANSVGYGRNPQETPSSYESMMMFNNERQISRGRRSSHNVSTLPSRSASHDPGSYFRDPQFGMMAGGNPNVQYSDITSVPSSQNGDVGTSNASDVYPIYRRARSSPPRITDIPSSYLIDNDKLMRNHVYPEDYNKAPVNLSSNSSSGNEEKSAMTMAAVSAERCTDWVSDSTECIKKNDLGNDNHYSLKDAGDTGSPSESEGKKKGTKRERSNEKRGNFKAGHPSSGDDSAAASCGSTPPMEGEGDDSSNSSDKDNVPHPPVTSHADKRGNDKESHKRVHYQDHKLSAKNIKHHQKQNRRLQRSPMKLVQSMSTAFQKPVKSKKQKTAKHNGGGEEFEEKDDENGSKNNGASDSNNSGEWTRSSSNTPSPPTSFGSVGSNDNSSSTDPSSTDPSTDAQQTMSTHFPKPFWKKRFCEDSGENSSTSQPAHNSSQQSLFSAGSNAKSQSDLETSTNSSGIGMEETQHLGKRRKIEIYEEDATNSYVGNKQNEAKTREMEVESQYSSNHGSSLEDLSRRSSPSSVKEGVNEFEKEQQQQRSSDSSPGVPNFTEASNTISTDSGHDSREVSD